MHSEGGFFMNETNRSLFHFPKQVCVTVKGVSESHDLIVEAESTMRGLIPREEISFHKKTDEQIERLVGKEMFCIDSGEKTADNDAILSAKEFERLAREKIIQDFETGRRNVYHGELIAVQQNRLFYSIVPGINACVVLVDYSFSRISTFYSLQIPKECQLVLKGDWSSLGMSASLKPAFGTFEQNIDKLSLKKDNILEAVVTGYSGNNSIVTLRPNIYSIIDGIYDLGTRVMIKITKVDPQSNRIKSKLLHVLETDIREKIAWELIVTDLGDWVDLDQFERENRIKKKLPQETIIEEVKTEAELSYDLSSSTQSPFWTYPDDRILKDNTPNVGNITFEIDHGYLNEHHYKVALMIDELKYATTYQLQRLLEIQGETTINLTRLRSVLQRLKKLGIIAMLEFPNSKTHVYYAGANYQKFTGRRPSRFTAYERMTQDPSVVKRRLAANNYLLGQIKMNGEVVGFDWHPDMLVSPKTKIRPQAVMQTNTKQIFIEGTRQAGHSDMLEKLTRYNKFFEEVHKNAEVVIVVEKEEDIAPMIDSVRALRLKKITVAITCDLLVFTSAERVEGYQSTFDRFLQFFH